MSAHARSSSKSYGGGAQKENSNCDNNNSSNNNNNNKRGSNQFQNAGNRRVGSSKGGGASCHSHQQLKTPLAPSSTSSVIIGGTSTRPIIAGANPRGRGANKLSAIDDGRDDPTKRQRTELPIVIPEALKRVLVEDWDLVSRQTHLVVIPSTVNVERVLGDYLKNREARPDPCIRSEFAASLKEYFNIMLGPQLLYRFERNQFNALEESRRRPASHPSGGGFYPSRYYGAVHLLRLFVKLGSVLSYTPLSQEERLMLLDVSHDFLDFLVEQRGHYFQLKTLLERAPKAYAEGAGKNGVVLD